MSQCTPGMMILFFVITRKNENTITWKHHMRLNNKMDLDHLIETRDYIYYNELLKANKNVRYEEEKGCVYYDYCGKKEWRSNLRINTLLFLREMGNPVGHYGYETVITLSLDSSGICRRGFNQKSYDSISRFFFRRSDDIFFWFVLLNIIVTEHDLGIITMCADTDQYRSLEKKIISGRRKNMFVG